MKNLKQQKKSLETLFQVPKVRFNRFSDPSSNLIKSQSKPSNISNLSKTKLELESKPSDPSLAKKNTEKLFLCKALNSPQLKETSFNKHSKSDITSLANNINTLTSRSKYPKIESFSIKKTLQPFSHYSPSPIIKHQESSPMIHEKMTFPLPGSQVAKKFMHRLSEFERNEVLEYSEVYYLGYTPLKKDLSVLDDDKGNYIAKNKDHIAYRFEILELLGSGSFGQVFRVHDHKSNTEQALKIISNRSRFQEQAFVEIKILKFLKKHDLSDSYSIVHINEYFSFRNHVCITFELLSISLYEFLKINSFKGLSSSLIRRFSSQILHALLLLETHNVIHCDLKPENILLKTQNRSIIKLIDFGSSCFTQERVFNYIQSRFYRAPEVILGTPYTSAIDIWSFGCILTELYTGKPLLPGQNEADQIMRIVELIGNPPEDILKKASRTNEFWVGRIWRAKEKVKFRRPLSNTVDSVLAGAEEAFIDLVKSCLKWDPSERITPKQALTHLWISQTTGKKSEELSPKHLKAVSQTSKSVVHIKPQRNSSQIYTNKL